MPIVSQDLSLRSYKDNGQILHTVCLHSNWKSSNNSSAVIVGHACNPSTWEEAEAEVLGVKGQPQQHNELEVNRVV